VTGILISRRLQVGARGCSRALRVTVRAEYEYLRDQWPRPPDHVAETLPMRSNTCFHRSVQSRLRSDRTYPEGEQAGFTHASLIEEHDTYSTRLLAILNRFKDRRILVAGD